MKRWWFIVGAVVVLVAASVGGVAWWLQEKQASSAADSAGGSEVLSDSSSSSGSSKDGSPSSSQPLVVNPSNSNSNVPLGNSAPGSNGSVSASNSIPINGLTGSTNSSSKSAASQAPGPDTFSQYDQYKDQSSALFGDLVVGNGPEVKAGSTVTVNYRGWLTNGKEFDESYARGQPYSFVEGAHTVVLGWEEGIFGMKVGGKRRVIIPPAVGYGAAGMGSAIPPNSVLVFDVELVGVQ